MKRKIAGIFLFLCLVVPVVATYTWLHHKVAIVRKTVKRKIIAGLDEEELVLLKFTVEASQTKLHWEHEKEFEYQGQMYDLVHAKIIGDSIFYWCWQDHEETKLNQQLDEILAATIRKDPQRKAQQERLFDFFKSLYLTKASSWQTVEFLPQSPLCSYLFTYQSVLLSPRTPPPESAI